MKRAFKATAGIVLAMLMLLSVVPIFSVFADVIIPTSPTPTASLTLIKEGLSGVKYTIYFVGAYGTSIPTDTNPALYTEIAYDTTDSSGECTFTGLEDLGIYLVVEDQTTLSSALPGSLAVEPFFVTLPATIDTGTSLEYDYDVEIPVKEATVLGEATLTKTFDGEVPPNGETALFDLHRRKLSVYKVSFEKSTAENEHKDKRLYSFEEAEFDLPSMSTTGNQFVYIDMSYKDPEAPEKNLDWWFTENGTSYLVVYAFNGSANAWFDVKPVPDYPDLFRAEIPADIYTHIVCVCASQSVADSGGGWSYKVGDSGIPGNWAQTVDIELKDAEYYLFDEDLETDEDDGTITVSDLQIGDYYFIEKSAVEGYILNNTKMHFSVTGTGTKYFINETEVAPEEFVLDNVSAAGGYNFIKIDADKSASTKPLAGAEFKVYTSDDISLKDEGGVNDLILTSGTDGTFSITDIPFGEYYLVEVKAPAGYQLKGVKIPFEVTATSFAETDPEEEGNGIDNWTGPEEITNVKDTELPDTGGMGTYIFTIVGFILIAVGCVLWLVSKKKRKEQQ